MKFKPLKSKESSKEKEVKVKKTKNINKYEKSKIVRSATSYKTAFNTGFIDRLVKKMNIDIMDVESNFTVHDDTAFTKQGYVRVYNILKYPPEVPYSENTGYLSAVLNSLYNIKELRGKVDFFTECFNRPHIMKFNKKSTQQYESLLKIRERLVSAINGNRDDKLTKSVDRELTKLGKDALNFRLQEVDKKLKSYSIIKSNQANGYTQVQSTQFIRMVCKEKSLLDVAEERLMSVFNSVDINLSKVKDLSSYYETFSPISGLSGINNSLDNYTTNLFTVGSYSKIRNKPTRIMENELQFLSRLLMIGTDITNDEPVSISLTSSGQGQNILIVGTTGSGKTYLFENLVQFARLLKFKLNLMDYKGNEYDPMLDIIPNSIKLDFSSACDSFVNVFKFNPSLYRGKDVKKAFAANINQIVTGFRILSGVKEEINNTEKLINEIVKAVYLKKHVYFDDPKSYIKSRNIDYKEDLKPFIDELLKDQSKHSVYGEKVCKNLYLGLAPYFNPSDPKSLMFTREINIDEVIKHDCIIYSYNMNSDSVWDNLIEYKVFMQDYITNMYIQHNKMNGDTTINSLEEYQRAVTQPESRRIYNNKLSGGRSDSVINVVLSNTIEPIMNKDNDIAAIRENIATIFIGKHRDMKALDEFASVYGIEEDREMINSVNNYEHVFYVKYDTGKQLGRNLITCIHPKFISDFLETKRIDRLGEFD